METYPFLEDNNSFQRLKTSLLEQARNESLQEDDVKAVYENKIVPLLLGISQNLSEERVLFLRPQNAFPPMPKPKTFEELRNAVIEEVDQDVPAEATSCAADSVTMGDIKISDIFLPYQKEVKAAVIGQLKEAEDKGDREAGVSIGADVFEILPLDDNEISKAAEAGDLDKELAAMILATRDEIRDNYGLSYLDRPRRIAMIRKAHLGVVEEEMLESEKDPRLKEPLSVDDVLWALGKREQDTLEGRQEKILRMRFGVGARETAEGSLGRELPGHMRARLDAMERRALGRTDITIIASRRGLKDQGVARKSLRIVRDQESEERED